MDQSQEEISKLVPEAFAVRNYTLQDGLQGNEFSDGAIGGYYGNMLANDGDEVHFLLGSDYEFVKSPDCYCNRNARTSLSGQRNGQGNDDT